MDKKIVIVGGGAGGLELACKLGRVLGPARVTLVDSRLSHIWKPSLHEVAAGTLDIKRASRIRCSHMTTASPSSTAH